MMMNDSHFAPLSELAAKLFYAHCREADGAVTSLINPESAFPAKNPVKPPNRENPRQFNTFAWRMSYAPAAIL
jgi:hypothetical protein